DRQEEAMAKQSFVPLMAVVLLCSASPARSQELPEGEGKELVAAQCNSCHPFYARVGAGYTAQGWHTVMRMMTNHGVSIPPGQRAQEARSGRQGSTHVDLLPGQNRLVHGTECQPGGPPRPQDWLDQAAHAADTQLAPLWHGGEFEG